MADNDTKYTLTGNEVILPEFVTLLNTKVIDPDQWTDEVKSKVTGLSTNLSNIVLDCGNLDDI